MLEGGNIYMYVYKSILYGGPALFAPCNYYMHVHVHVCKHSVWNMLLASAFSTEFRTLLVVTFCSCYVIHDHCMGSEMHAYNVHIHVHVFQTYQIF